MNRSGITVILIALFFSVLLTGLVFKFQKQKNKPQQEATYTRILAATKNLNRGDVLTNTDIQWQAWPRTGMSSQFIIEKTRKIDDVVGAIVRTPINSGQPITDNMIVQKGNISPLASILKPGMRAFTIEVTKDSGGGGLILPGDTVDVLLTYASIKAETREKEYTGKTILKNISIMAVDQNITSTAVSSKDPSVKTVTLEVTPKQAEILAIGKSAGSLSLSLSGVVSSLDNNSQSKQTITYQEDVISSNHGKSVKPAHDTSGTQMTLIHGEKIEQK